jgi:phosphatidylserine decarboxylase
MSAIRLAFHQYLPAKALSKLLYFLTRIKVRWFKNAFISVFAKQFGINWNEALAAGPEHYVHFNAFFTRELKPGARPLATASDAILCPADGAVSAAAPITADRVLQAKGHDYSLATLLGDAELAREFEGGDFITVYLSPRDYHRVHMPMAGSLETTIHVPGKLFSVQVFTVDRIPALFARNERVVSIFRTDSGQRFAQVLVGAVNVSSIETVWAGAITPPYGREIVRQSHSGPRLERGAEMGRFNMGSTVILVVPKSLGGLDLPRLPTGQALQMGQAIGQLR